MGKVRESGDWKEAWALRDVVYLQPQVYGRRLLDRRKHSVVVELTEGIGRREQAVWRAGLGKEKVILVGFIKNVRANEFKAF